MTFKDNLSTDAYTTFLNTSEHAEVITYTPNGGSPASIKAIVIRQRVEPASEDHGRGLKNEVEIMIANDATYGVTSVDKGNDTVALKKVIGDTSDTIYFLADILSHDDGMWHLLLRI